jgi:hypothetical protein
MVTSIGSTRKQFRISDLMVRLGGGDLEILENFPHDRARYLQMAGVLLTTSGIAVMSMTFALHDALREPLFWAIAFGVIWGIIILNLDRFLVLSMGSIRDKLRLFWIFLPRFLMAVVLAAVISTPLVLRIFSSDIKRELFVIQQRESAQQSKLIANSAKAREAKTLAAKIAADKSILAGHLPQPVTNSRMQEAQSMVATLTPEVQAAQKAEINARAVWQCELYGVGPHCLGNSGIPGPGPISDAKKQLYESALQHYGKLNGQLSSATATMRSAQTAVGNSAAKNLAQDEANARKELPGREKQYAVLEAYISGAIQSGTNADNRDVGILAQLQALSAASANNSSLNAARLAVLALFFLIEILPVSVKFLLNLGPLSGYEIALKSRDDDKVDKIKLARAEGRRREEGESQDRITREEDIRSIELGKVKARVKVEEDMRGREVDLGQRANEYVASEMKKILDVALGQWSRQVQRTLSGSVGSQGHPGTVIGSGNPQVSGSGNPLGSASPSSNGSTPPNLTGGPAGLPSGNKL